MEFNAINKTVIVDGDDVPIYRTKIALGLTMDNKPNRNLEYFSFRCDDGKDCLLSGCHQS